MKRPLWMTLVGVAALLIGFWGILGNLLSILGSWNMGHSPEAESVEVRKGRHLPPPENFTFSEKAPPSEILPDDGSITQPSTPWTEDPSWIMATGLMTLLISTAYFAAGILFLVKTSGIGILYGAVASSILWTFVRTTILAQGDMATMMVLGPMAMPGIMIDVILGAAVFLGCLRNPPPSTVVLKPTTSVVPGTQLPNPMTHRVFVITGCVVILFVMIFPFWIMGIPGVQNTYAQGWDMGFHVLIWYPIIWAVINGISWVLKKTISSERYPTLERIVSASLIIGLALAVLLMAQAITLMAS